MKGLNLNSRNVSLAMWSEMDETDGESLYVVIFFLIWDSFIERV